MTSAVIAHHRPTAARSPARVAFIDGLRGLAALYVVVAHALAVNMPGTATPGLGVFSTGATWDRVLYLVADSSIVFSRYGVVLFIVLSGCSLMLPVAQAATTRLPGGFRKYAVRRARRILPPYYAAVLGSLVLIALVPGMSTDAIAWWSGALPAFDLDVLVSHVLLVHNWNPEWAFRINPPLWTIPIEWQIYFVFPLLLLPVWRRFGEVLTAVLAFSIGLGLYFIIGPAQLIQSAPWFLGLFALGMAAAVYGFSPARALQHSSRSVLGVAGGALLLFLVVAPLLRFTALDFAVVGWVGDVLFGAATAAFIVYCARVDVGERTAPIAVRWLHSRPAVRLGWFSYSLYLVHAPVLIVTALAMGAPDRPALWYVPGVLAGIAISVASAYLFHLVFERPFMPRHLRDAPAGRGESGPISGAADDATKSLRPVSASAGPPRRRNAESESSPDGHGA